MEGMQLEEGIVLPERRCTDASPIRSLVRGPWPLLAAVGLVVVLVSLPRLRGLALKANELDAIQTMSLLEKEVLAAPAEPRTLGELIQSDKALLRRLPDTRLMEDGRLLIRHGYLFELVRTGGSLGLCAWPLSHGETGLGAFCTTPQGGLLGHPNHEALWNGLDPPATLPDPTGWREVSSLLPRTP